jgi:hypothetical protein
VFFDPYADHPRALDEGGEGHLTRMGKMAMRSAGLDEATTYAWHKTGLLVSEENEDMLSGDDLEDWRALSAAGPSPNIRACRRRNRSMPARARKSVL